MSASIRTTAQQVGEWGSTERDWRPATRRIYEGYIDRLSRRLQQQGIALDDANYDDLRLFVASHGSAAGRNGARKALLALSQVMVAEGRWSEHLAAQLPTIRQPRRVPRLVSHDQARTIMATARRAHPERRTTVALMLLAGLRITEARLLEWSDIVDGWMTIRGKGGREREMAVHGDLAAALEAWSVRAWSPRWVLPSPEPGVDRPASDTAIRQWVASVGESAGVEHLRPHDLRRAWATLLLDSGADVQTIQAGLGHSSLATTQLYLATRPKRLAEAVQGLDLAS